MHTIEEHVEIIFLYDLTNKYFAEIAGQFNVSYPGIN